MDAPQTGYNTSVAKLDELLDEANDALADGRSAEALEKAKQALADAPNDLEALGLRAAALTELGAWEQADAAYADLMKREPKEPTWALAAADLFVRQPGDDPERTEAAFALLENIAGAVRKDDRLRFEWALTRALCFLAEGELEGAREDLEIALKVEPEDYEARQTYAEVLLELGKLAAAKTALEKLAEDFPDDPAAWHFLGVLAERAGDEVKAEACFRTATGLDAEAFPPATKLSEAEFDAAVKEAIAKLPEHAKAELGNVTMSVEPFPDDASLGGEVTPLILGVFVGTPIDARSPVVAEHHLTAEIILYQRNLQRFARTRDELIEQIGITVLHEVGHLLGLDEDQLYDRGLD